MSFPTSYIKTTSSQVTRSADNASVDDLSGWFNGSEFTWLIDFADYDLLPRDTSNNYLLALNGRSLELRLNSNIGIVAMVSGTVSARSVSTVGISSGKIAISYKAGSRLIVAHDGAIIYQNKANYDAITSDGSVSIDGKRNDGTPTNFNKFTRKLDSVIPRALSAESLAILTAPDT